MMRASIMTALLFGMLCLSAKPASSQRDRSFAHSLEMVYCTDLPKLQNEGCKTYIYERFAGYLKRKSKDTCLRHCELHYESFDRDACNKGCEDVYFQDDIPEELYP
ncbi:hypothetical protein DFW101_1061 [Solidesulfovibrio carbinoliphilus subsp. oakridgensis]|uniref:Uncharacterized protein n=1 Tax=Solidesulfovibrio carbinoliphilus subsp. oakridgensis TaxID=694327 RepID=G7Q656_9BACT|nr:hypothetical protein DFW101_1061 [Solidesulfovibrio carbinoliphilus subsp. oakridgensis]